jgi:hypothetical protein
MSIHTNGETNSYGDAANQFVQQIRQLSPSAADCIEQIRDRFGTRAAYLAAFALILLKNQQVEKQFNPSQRDLYAFTYCEEMRDTAGAMQLYEEAANHLLPGINGTQAH